MWKTTKACNINLKEAAQDCAQAQEQWGETQQLTEALSFGCTGF